MRWTCQPESPGLAVLSGCASLPSTVTELIDQRRVEYAVARHGPPVVVFENGLGGTLHWWAKVFPEIAKETTAFAYNRPDYGGSDPVETPRDGTHIVDELGGTLRTMDLSPPYLLVGHSLGGLYMQLYARQYPDEVQALVLVDSTHPEQFSGNGSPERWPFWLHWLFWLGTSSTEKAEFEAIPATGEQVLSLPTLTGIPVVVLSARKPMHAKSDLADDANAKRVDIARRYPGSTQVWADCGHGIPLDCPEAVIAAIHAVIGMGAHAPHHADR